MSSKRKNTPTKLAQDEVMEQRSASDDEARVGTPMESDSDGDLTMERMNHTPTDDHNELESFAADRLPQSKKHRILQSVYSQDSDDSDVSNNNHKLVHKSSPPRLHRKSMDSVIRRLNSRAASPDSSDTEKLVQTVSESLSSGEMSVAEKEQKISEMIAQLQSLKESIAVKKETNGGVKSEPKVSCAILLHNLRSS